MKNFTPTEIKAKLAQEIAENIVRIMGNPGIKQVMSCNGNLDKLLFKEAMVCRRDNLGSPKKIFTNDKDIGDMLKDLADWLMKERTIIARHWARHTTKDIANGSANVRMKALYRAVGDIASKIYGDAVRIDTENKSIGDLIALTIYLTTIASLRRRSYRNGYEPTKSELEAVQEIIDGFYVRPGEVWTAEKAA